MGRVTLQTLANIMRVGQPCGQVCLSQVSLFVCKPALLKVRLAWLQGLSDELLHVMPHESYEWYHQEVASAYVRDTLTQHYINI